MSFTVAAPLSAKIARATAVSLLLLLSACGTPEEKAQNYYRRGMELAGKSDFVRARLEFRNAIQIKSDFLPALHAIADLEEKQQNWPAANAALRRIATVDPKDMESRLRLSTMALFAGRFQEALEWVDAATAIDETNARAHGLRAATLFKLGDEPTALQEARRSLELAPGNEVAVTVLAAARMAHEDSDGALQILDSIAGDTTNLSVELFKITIYGKRGELDQVEKRLRNLIERYPQEQALGTQLLQFYLSQNRTDDAEQLLRRAADRDLSNSTPGLTLVRFLKEARGEAAARQELLARSKQASDPFSYQMALAELDIVTGRNEAAEGQFKTLIADDKDRAHVEAAQLRLAQLYVATKRFALADPLIADVLRGDRGNGLARRLRATMLLERGQLDEAIGQLREALNDQPRSAELMLLLAVAYERSGSIELAGQQFANAARASEFAPATALDYVAFLLRRGGSGKAEEVLQELSSKHPENIDVLSALAQLRLERQNWSGARETAEAIRRIEKRDGRADQIVGAVLLGQKNYQDSVVALTKAYDANPGETRSMFALVRSYVLAKEPDKADVFLNAVISKNSTNAEAHVLKGLLQMSGNQPAEAAQSFKAAIEANPKNAAGYQALADLRVKQKNYNEALNVLREGLRAEPTSAPLLLAFAEGLELNGDFEAAITAYERMLQNEPGSLIALNNLASLLAEHRNDDASLDRAAHLAKGLAKSEIPQFMDTLGWIRSRKGEYNAAIPLLESATAALPQNATVSYHLGMTYLKAGASAKAYTELRKASSLLGDGDKALAAKIQAALKDTPG